MDEIKKFNKPLVATILLYCCPADGWPAALGLFVDMPAL